MLRRITLSVFAIAIGAMAADAADLPAQSRLGAVFADRPLAEALANRDYGYTTVYAPPVHIPPLVAGYYGKPNSYFYSPYYGRSLDYNFARLPYACGFHGYC
ncbi:hypothetical protein [uncultured Bradyrhizobium sp.]|uniref:hypothetical protein n=1 Tax=uncultured Bradyrhizobium sp. TaxID=199684 RepID=UPI0035CC7B94